jgi:hypothetical protein
MEHFEGRVAVVNRAGSAIGRALENGSAAKGIELVLLAPVGGVR